MISPEIDVVSKPYEGELPHAVTIFMEIMDSIGSQQGLQWSFVGGFARDKLLGYDPNDFDVATWNNHFFREKMLEVGCLKIGRQTEPRRKPHDYFSDPYEFSKKDHPIHWIEGDMEAAFAPTRFDFTINHFAMKSDRRIYAPTYAWKDVSRKILRISKEAPKSTNVLLRGVRFACKYGLEIEPKTLEIFQERIRLHTSKEDIMGDDIILMNLKKMDEDGIGPQCLDMIKDIGLELAPGENGETMFGSISYYETKIERGDAHYEPRNDYDDLD